MTDGSGRGLDTVSYYEEMLTSAQMGQWGFSTRLVGNQGSPQVQGDVITVGSSAYASKAWTMTLCAFRFTATLAPGLILGAAQPSDNQTWSGLMRFGLVWGTANGSERAIVDWPARGCTFQLQGSYVRGSLFSDSSVSQNPPMLSGFITPSPRVVTAVVAPTYTTSASPLVVQGTPRRYPVPDRAVAYRWWTLVQPVTPFSIMFTQQNGDGANVQYDASVPSAAVGAFSQESLMGNKMGYVPLNPLAQFVSVANLDAVNPVGVGLTFLLDLG